MFDITKPKPNQTKLSNTLRRGMNFLITLSLD